MRILTTAALTAGLIFAGVGPALAQDTTTTPAASPAMVTEEEDDGFDLGWLGLIGLAGLMGLRRKREDVSHRPATTATSR